MAQRDCDGQNDNEGLIWTCKAESQPYVVVCNRENQMLMSFIMLYGKFERVVSRLGEVGEYSWKLYLRKGSKIARLEGYAH